MKFLAILLALVVVNNALERHICNHGEMVADLKRFQRREHKKREKGGKKKRERKKSKNGNACWKLIPW